VSRVLSLRALNRATLERQLLLRRSRLAAREAVAHLIALQAQEADPPYLGLWSRVEGFTHGVLTTLLYERAVVRGPALRATQHLLCAEDFLWLRPLVQPVLERGRQAAMGRLTRDVDLGALASAARELLQGRTLTRTQLRELLRDRWPESDPDALAWSVQYLVPVIHPPPNGTWRRRGPTPITLAEAWLGRPLERGAATERLIRRYLAAFGPATAADVQTWSGLRGCDEVLEEMRPSLRALRSDTGDQLFDIPDAPLPDPDVPAPPRFLPRFDNLLVAHADRRRLVADDDRRRVITGSLVRATLMLDGFVQGTWTLTDGTLTVNPFRPLSPEETAAVAEEGHRLLAFAAAGAPGHAVSSAGADASCVVVAVRRSG
jgi:hypothetical protein